MLESWSMKKLLAIVVLGLLWSGSSYAETFFKLTGCDFGANPLEVDLKKKNVKFTGNRGVYSGLHKISKIEGLIIETKRKKTSDYGTIAFRINLAQGEVKFLRPLTAHESIKLCNEVNGKLTRHGIARNKQKIKPQPKTIVKKPDDLPSNVNHVYCYNPDTDRIIKMESYSKCPGKMIRVKGPNSPKPTVKPKIVDDGRIIKIGSGTGFIVSKEGHIVSNNHVVGVCKKVITNIEGKEINLDIIATDKVNDLGLIKGNINSSNYLSLKKDGAELGEDIVAFGYPLTQQLSDSVKLTKGIVSSLSGMENNYSQIQIDAAIQPGNSGGPVINMSGQVVGVASSGLSKMYMAKKAQYIPENVNFAVASPTLYTFLKANKVSVSSGPSFRSFSTKELAKIGTPATLQLFCMNTKTEYAKLKQAKTHSDMLLDLD